MFGFKIVVFLAAGCYLAAMIILPQKKDSQIPAGLKQEGVVEKEEAAVAGT